VIGTGGRSVSAIEYSVDGFIDGVSPYADTLGRIDPATGPVETIGSLEFDLEWSADLDDGAQGQLWMLVPFPGRLCSIDRISGAATLRCQEDDIDVTGLVSIGDTMYTTRWAQSPPANPGCGLECLGGSRQHLDLGPDGWVHEL